MSRGRGKKREQESMFWRKTTPNPAKKGKEGGKELPADQLPPPPPPSHPVRNPTANRRGR